MEQDKFVGEEFEKAVNNNIYNTVSKFTVNRSEEAEAIRESLKDGHILTDEEKTKISLLKLFFMNKHIQIMKLIEIRLMRKSK